MSKDVKNRKGSPFVWHEASAPDHAQAACALAREIGAGSAIVLGGAVMDAQQARPARDLDLYIALAPADRPQAIEQIERQASAVQVFNSTSLVAHMPGGMKLDITFTDKPQTPAQLISAVSVGVCAIAHDLFAARTWVAPDYVADHEARQIRLRAHAKPTAQNKAYLQKLQSKMPEYRCVK